MGLRNAEMSGRVKAQVGRKIEKSWEREKGAERILAHFKKHVGGKTANK